MQRWHTVALIGMVAGGQLIAQMQDIPPSVRHPQGGGHFPSVQLGAPRAERVPDVDEQGIPPFPVASPPAYVPGPKLGAPLAAPPPLPEGPQVLPPVTVQESTSRSSSVPTTDTEPARGSPVLLVPACVLHGGRDYWGPTLPEEVLSDTAARQRMACDGLRLYGWANFGYTDNSIGSGLMTVEPRPNRFGNEFLFNQVALVAEKTLGREDFDWGFKAVYYAGADASLLHPLGGFDNSDPRFSHDLFELYASAHFPTLTEGGMDLRVGRMATIIGYESALAPYRPFYSNSYQWFYSQDFAWTGALATFHMNENLDILHGITMGANTFFQDRTGACYIGQVNYWPGCDHLTLLSAGLYVGEQAILAAPGRAGDLATVVELRVQHTWNQFLSQVVQSNMGWDQNVPGVGTAQWYSIYSMWLAHLTPHWDLNFRAEWFRDIGGTRTGIDAHYAEFTIGVDWHPTRFLRIRPEIRGDVANRRAFGIRTPSDYGQMTVGVEALVSY